MKKKSKKIINSKDEKLIQSLADDLARIQLCLTYNIPLEYRHKPIKWLACYSFHTTFHK